MPPVRRILAPGESIMEGNTNHGSAGRATMVDVARRRRREPEDRLARGQRRAGSQAGNGREGERGRDRAALRTQRHRRKSSPRRAVVHPRPGDRGRGQPVLLDDRAGRRGERARAVEHADHGVGARGPGARARARDRAAAPAGGRAARGADRRRSPLHPGCRVRRPDGVRGPAAREGRRPTPCWSRTPPAPGAPSSICSRTVTPASRSSATTYGCSRRASGSPGYRRALGKAGLRSTDPGSSVGKQHLRRRRPGDGGAAGAAARAAPDGDPRRQQPLHGRRAARAARAAQPRRAGRLRRLRARRPARRSASSAPTPTGSVSSPRSSRSRGSTATIVLPSGSWCRRSSSLAAPARSAPDRRSAASVVSVSDRRTDQCTYTLPPPLADDA